jgi:hypothetical protein
MARSQGVEVAFVGEQTRDQLRLWYHLSDIVVYPTRAEEPFGLVPIEAQAAGVPVIVTRSGGLPETMRDGITGIVVEPKDPVALADAIASLLKEPGRRSQMGRAAAGYIQTCYSSKKTADKLSHTYLEAVISRSNRHMASKPILHVPQEPLRVLDDGYNGLLRPGELMSMGPSAASRSDLIMRWQHIWLDFVRKVAPSWKRVCSRGVGTFWVNESSLVTCDPTRFPAREIGYFIGVVLPPGPSRDSMSVTRQDVKSNHARYDLAKIYPKHIVLKDPEDNGHVMQVNPYPKVEFHSLLISKKWRHQRLTLNSTRAQLHWVRHGAVSEFHRGQKFIDHLHIHIHARHLMPIVRFADRFIELHRKSLLSVGRLDYPLPNIALASMVDEVLADATHQMAKWLDYKGILYYEAALLARDARLALTVFVFPKKSIDVTPAGIIKLKNLGEKAKAVWSRILGGIYDEAWLAPLRKDFMKIYRSA